MAKRKEKRKGVNYRKNYIKKRQDRVRKIRKTAPFVGIGVLIAGALTALIYGGMIGYEKVAAAVASSDLLTVRKVTVKGNDRVSLAEILNECGIDATSKIFKVNNATVAAHLTDNPWIGQVRCIKKWWGSVVIEIRERTPIALANVGEVVLVDGSGAVIPLEKGRTYNLPMINGAHLLTKRNGERYIDSGVIARVRGFIEAVDAVDSSLFDIVTQLDISDRYVVRGFAVAPETVIEIGYDADSAQVKNLRYLLDAFVARHETPARINVQYRNLAFVKNNEHKGSVLVD
jgi:cell division septal protein FtsQ